MKDEDEEDSLMGPWPDPKNENSVFCFVLGVSLGFLMVREKKNAVNGRIKIFSNSEGTRRVSKKLKVLRERQQSLLFYVKYHNKTPIQPLCFSFRITLRVNVSWSPLYRKNISQLIGIYIKTLIETLVSSEGVRQFSTCRSDAGPVGHIHLFGRCLHICALNFVRIRKSASTSCA